MKTYASLCTGEGLMDVGAEMAGFKPIWGIEVDAKHASIAQANLGHEVHACAIETFDWRKVDRPNHLHISPPCTRASVGNSKMGEAATDAAIAKACIDAIQHFQPDSFTLENVTNYRNFKSFQAIVDCLWGAGYWVNVEMLNAADFGVPQTRKRLFVRAVKGRFPMPMPPTQNWRSWYEAIKDLLPKMPAAKIADWQRRSLDIDFGKSGLHLIETQNASRAATVREQSQPAMTVVSSWDGRFPKILDLKAETGWRLDVKSIARLQSVPDCFQGATVKGLGNGVPCLLAKAVMESFGA